MAEKSRKDKGSVSKKDSPPEEEAQSSSNINKTERDNQDQNSDEIDPSAVIEELPPDVKRVVETGLSIQRFTGTMPNPILSKITPEHIDKILGISEKEEENDFKSSKAKRGYNLIYVILFISLFIFLTIYLVGDNTDLYQEIIKIMVAVIGGFGGGYGYKSYRDRNHQD